MNNNLPTIHGYVRVSSDDQAKNGFSLETQQKLVLEFMQRAASEKGLRVGNVFVETLGVSALKIPLPTRPAGADLCNTLNKGDHVVFSRHDRAFRNVRDMSTMVAAWSALNITAHMMNLGCDTSTSHGKLLINFLVSAAQWESETKGERQREVNASLKASGVSPFRLPVGTVALGVKKGKARVLAWDKQVLAIGRLLCCWKKRGVTQRQICEKIDRKSTRLNSSH